MMAVLVACGGEDPTATPRPAATPTPAEATMEEPTPAPEEAMMEKEPTPTPASTGGAAPSQPAPTATPRPAAPTATPVPPPGFDAAEYFRGKTVRIVANSSPGGGTDTQGRVMAAFMSRYIPGNPRVVFTKPAQQAAGVHLRRDRSAEGRHLRLLEQHAAIGLRFQRRHDVHQAQHVPGARGND